MSLCFLVARVVLDATAPTVLMKALLPAAKTAAAESLATMVLLSIDADELISLRSCAALAVVLL